MKTEGPLSEARTMGRRARVRVEAWAMARAMTKAMAKPPRTIRLWVKEATDNARAGARARG